MIVSMCGTCMTISSSCVKDSKQEREREGWEASLFSLKTASEKWLKNWSAENCKVWGKNNRIDNKE